MSTRRFGWIRKLPSGRYQASYVGPDGKRHTAPQTYATRAEANRWLTGVEKAIARGSGPDEALGRTPFGEYALGWLRDNPDIGPRWRETCERNLRVHLAPLEPVLLHAMTPVMVREWYAEALRGPGGNTSIAQSYRFLRAVMNAAVREGAIYRNPANLPGAGADRAPERTVATPTQVVQLLEAITPRYRAAVVLAAWAGLRRGEVLGLRVDDLDLDNAEVTVRRSRTELLASPEKFDKQPKTAAGHRTVALPPHVMPILSEHVERYAGDEWLFVSKRGERMLGNTIRLAFTRARAKAGMPGFTFHDLRHTGLTLAAATGATLADLMQRGGHSSPAAAQRYLHAIEGRDQEIADALSRLAEHGDAAALPEHGAADTHGRALEKESDTSGSA